LISPPQAMNTLLTLTFVKINVFLPSCVYKINMDIILITGSPGAGKTSISNALSEFFRISQVHHIVIDPDEIARIYPEDSLRQLKLDGLESLYQLYAELSVEKIIIPMTIDSDADLDNVQAIFGKENVKVINLIVDENTLIRRVVKREPNEHWQITLSNLVKAYIRNESARSYSRIDIDANDKSIPELVKEICANTV